MAEKRPHEDDSTQQNGAKRARSNEPSPAPAAGKLSALDQIAAIKARQAAKANASQTSAPPASQAASVASAARAKIEALKARMANATGGATAAPQRNSSPMPPQDFDDGAARARGGLGTALHPALMADAAQDRSRAKGPMPTRFGTTIGNRRPVSPVAPVPAKKQLDLSGPTLEELKKDPYFDPSVNSAPRGRKSRDLLFHQKGKFIQQATALRRQAQLEAMKKRIAETQKRMGMDDDRSEQAFVVQEPPKLEWWDEGLIDGDTYPDFDDDDIAAEAKCKITSADSVITRYVQHPVLLDPPQDKHIPAAKPMFMTKEEQAKKRRQDRMEVRKEQQAKIRLGLEPPEPPKVKKSNLMRVLGNEAVKDPTAVEARVNSEIAARARKHDQTNEARALTAEQRAERLADKQAKDVSKGVYVCVFRIDSLAFGKHRYLIDMNAKQRGITGIVLLHPRCNVVIVEGGEHDIRNYRKLMTQRIKWSDIEIPTESALQNEREHHSDIASKTWLQAVDEKTGELKDQSENQCVLVWEGQEKDRAFRKWGSRVCETDAEARRALEKNKMENMWQLAKSYVA